MSQSINSKGVVQQVGKILLECAEFIISPWLNRAAIKSLQKRVELLEQRVYKGLPHNEQLLESRIERLQLQLDSLQNIIKNPQDKVVEYNERQPYVSGYTGKPSVEDLMLELEDQKQYGEVKLADSQKRQDRFQQSRAQMQQLTASFPYIEAQTAARLEAGRWLLSCRVELAQEVAQQIMNAHHPHIEEFLSNISRYLKLLGACLENAIEPRLLYKGVIIHYEPPIETYLKAFELIKTKYISDWESSEQLSNQASEELRNYFSYLIDYLIKV
jgi:hypothetical protein